MSVLKKVNFLIAILTAICFSEIAMHKLSNSGDSSNESTRALAKIMVVPYNKQNEDIRTVLDE